MEAAVTNDVVKAKWSDEQCFRLNAHQHNQEVHPYTCGNDSRHRPLIATENGWRCADCDYRQDWAHEATSTEGEPATAEWLMEQPGARRSVSGRILVELTPDFILDSRDGADWCLNIRPIWPGRTVTRRMFLRLRAALEGE